MANGNGPTWERIFGVAGILLFALASFLTGNTLNRVSACENKLTDVDKAQVVQAEKLTQIKEGIDELKASIKELQKQEK